MRTESQCKLRQGKFIGYIAALEMRVRYHVFLELSVRDAPCRGLLEAA